MSRFRTVAIALVGLATVLTSTAQAVRPQDEKAKVRLALDRTAYAAGSTARLATVLEIEPGWHANSNTPTFEYLIPTTVELAVPAGWSAPELRYPAGAMKAFAFADQPLSVFEGKVVVIASLALPRDLAAGAHPVAVTVTYQACNDSSCLPPVTKELATEIKVGSGGKENEPGLFGGAAAPPATPGRSLAGILLLALLGGLILNVMPCVLPVLSLKVFGMVRSAHEGRGAIVAGSLATATGILVSFWALAAAAVAAKAAGSAVGWGIQFQSPAFVTFLALVVVLFCLNLWGVFEITLPGRLAQVGGAAAREGLGGHFASGLFATLMATPCSAPFLGTALGFALAQSAGVIVAVLTAVGLGMALPYLALAVAPGAARFLPRPGAWMDTVKGLMGFLLAGALIWLLYVLAAQVSAVRLAVIELGLLGLALFLWWRRRAGETGFGRQLAMGGAIAVIMGTIYLAAKSPAVEAATAGPDTSAQSLIAWAPFDEAQAQALAAEGRPVFVDVTAEWCFTCKYNEKLVINTPEVADAFSRHGVLAMKADWTNRNDAIGDYLARFGRYGIPFYVLYRPGQEPHVFSELLTQKAVLEALGGLGEKKVAAGS